MKTKILNPTDYIKQAPTERQPALQLLRNTILEHLPDGFDEGINYNMIGYYVPHTYYPNGYHCDNKLPLPFINIASQKNFIALYHMGIYAKKELLGWFITQYPKHCKYKLDMGKSCIRFKKMNDIPFELIGELITKMTCDEWINIYEKSIKK